MCHHRLTQGFFLDWNITTFSFTLSRNNWPISSLGFAKNLAHFCDSCKIWFGPSWKERDELYINIIFILLSQDVWKPFTTACFNEIKFFHLLPLSIEMMVYIIDTAILRHISKYNIISILVILQNLFSYFTCTPHNCFFFVQLQWTNANYWNKCKLGKAGLPKKIPQKEKFKKKWLILKEN